MQNMTNMLTRLTGEIDADKIDFNPFPFYSDREVWDNLPSDAKDFYRVKAQELKNKTYISLPASLYMDFTRNGNRSNYENLYFTRRSDLMILTIAECIEAKGEYLDAIINLIWAISEETSWVIPAHNNKGELPDIEFETFVDLFSAETGSLFAWVYYFLHDVIAEVSPTVKRRMEIEIERKILTPYLTYSHFWWMGFDEHRSVNNWNPWINSNVIVAFLIFEKDKKRLAEGIAKTAKSVDVFIDSYYEDGACDEGPGYFNAAGAVMFDYLDILYNISNKQIDIYGFEKIKNIARYIYRVYIDGEYFVNFADSSLRAGMSSRHMQRVGEAIGDDTLIEFAQMFVSRHNAGYGDIGGYMKYRALRNLFEKETAGVKLFTPPVEYWFKDTEILTARDGGQTDAGMFIAAKGGHNAESHNHNDVGNFILYMNGKPVIVDAGVETYTRFTFSSERYSIWTMQSCYHNLPTINGYDQLSGRERKSSNVKYDSDGSITHLSMELKHAYPPEAGIESYVREFIFERGKSFTVHDKYSLKQAVKPLIFNILCFDKPNIMNGGYIKLNENINIELDSDIFSTVYEEIKLTDPQLRRNWDTDCLYRIRLTEEKMQKERDFCIKFHL
ncbi:MAG: heparinase II/III-family protein [Oscillospiraceae bacterium]|nr:heparinase II/III-family protein [Oscillospiraceae bacterium]